MTENSSTPPQGRRQRPQTASPYHTRAQERVSDVFEALSAGALSTLLSASLHPRRTIPQAALETRSP